MPEKRRAKRWQLFYYLRVFDVESGDLMGHVMDITTQGMMLVSETAVPKGQVFNLRMELPDVEGLPPELSLRAQSRWSTCDVKEHFYDTGFTLVNPPEATIATIGKIIEALQFGPEKAPAQSRLLSKTGTD